MSASLKLLLDVQATQSTEHADRGLARYVACHAGALTRLNGLARGVLFNPTLPAASDALVKNDIQGQVFWNTRRTVLDLLGGGDTAYYMMSPFEMASIPQTVVPDYALTSGAPLIVTLYDLIPLVLRERYLNARAIAKMYERRIQVLREADLILSISQSAKNDAIRLMNLDEARIRVIGGGVDSSFCPRPDGEKELPETLRDLGVHDRYVLSILGDDPRKNLDGLCVAFAQLPREVRQEFDLVIVGRYRERIIQEAFDLFASESDGVGRIVFTGCVSDEALIDLYRSATLSVMPSIYEGFGLPVVEAISCGCPTITSNASSLPEVLQWEAAQFDPHDVKAMSQMMYRGLTDREFRSELTDVGGRRTGEHTWDRVAERTLQAVQEMQPKRAARKTKQRRIALVGPLPPVDSGIADHNLRVVRELLRRCSVDVYVPDLPAQEDRLGLSCRILPLASLGEITNPASYDAVIYTLGNSVHHWDSLKALRKFGGIVWLHDARFYGIYVGKAEGVGTLKEMRAFMRKCLLQVYGTDTPVAGQETKCMDHAWYIRNNVNLAKEIVSLADGVIAHSQFAMSMIEHDAKESFVGKRRWVLPMAFSRVKDVPDRGSSKTLTISTFGRVYPTKGPDILIDTLARLKNRDTRLVLAGNVSDWLKDRLDAHAREAGVRDRVHFTGRLSGEEYAAWLRRSDIIVQLRTMDNGESSGAVCDCMAAGLPVITNLGAAKEFPDNCLIKLPGQFTTEQVMEQIEELVENPAQRAEYGENAMEFARANSFSHIADLLLKKVDDYVAGRVPDEVTSSSSPFVRFP